MGWLRRLNMIRRFLLLLPVAALLLTICRADEQKSVTDLSP